MLAALYVAWALGSRLTPAAMEAIAWVHDNLVYLQASVLAGAVAVLVVSCMGQAQAAWRFVADRCASALQRRPATDGDHGRDPSGVPAAVRTSPAATSPATAPALPVSDQDRVLDALLEIRDAQRLLAERQMSSTDIQEAMTRAAAVPLPMTPVNAPLPGPPPSAAVDQRPAPRALAPEFAALDASYPS